jgi:hypothetical protein
LLARNVDLHFVHRKGATLAKRCYSGAPASPPPTGCGRSFVLRLLAGQRVGSPSGRCLAARGSLSPLTKRAALIGRQIRGLRRCGLSGPNCRAADRRDRCWLAYCGQ